MNWTEIVLWALWSLLGLLLWTLLGFGLCMFFGPRIFGPRGKHDDEDKP
jgi:hypothetical protein